MQRGDGQARFTWNGLRTTCRHAGHDRPAATRVSPDRLRTAQHDPRVPPPPTCAGPARTRDRPLPRIRRPTRHRPRCRVRPSGGVPMAPRERRLTSRCDLNRLRSKHPSVPANTLTHGPHLPGASAHRPRPVAKVYAHVTASRTSSPGTQDPTVTHFRAEGPRRTRRRARRTRPPTGRPGLGQLQGHPALPASGRPGTARPSATGREAHPHLPAAGWRRRPEPSPSQPRADRPERLRGRGPAT